MSVEPSGEVPVTFAKGVLDDVAELTATSPSCRRVRFDVPTYDGKPRFRLIYRNEPSDGAPAECHWLAIAPRSGLRAHRKAQQRSQSG